MTNFMTYKGYTASMVFDTEDKIIVGRVQDVDDIISFHGESVSVFESNFHAVIDDYLAASKELGSAPEKPASGKVMLRIAPEVHAAVDGVFEEAAGEGRAAAQAQARAPGVIFHPASGIACEVVAQVQASLRKRILRGFVGRGLLEGFEAKEMLAYRHSGFSVDTSVCIAAHDRAGLERLLWYCARPPFAMERLRKAGGELVYRCAKQHSEPGHDKRGTQVDEITLTPLELIDRIAALVPPPRTHRHRYFGVLAPHSPHRAAVTEMAQSAAAQPTQPAQVQAEPASTDAGEGALGAGNPRPTQAEPTQPAQPAQPVPPKRPAHYLWAVLMARIYEVFPVVCPICGGQMRIIAFITHSADIRHILEHIVVETEPPRITPARGPPLWDGCEAQIGEGVDVASDWDDVAQVAPDFEADQRVSW